MSQFKDDIRLRLSGSWQSTVEVAGSIGPQRGLDHYQLVRKTYSHLLRMEEDGEVVSTVRSDEDGCRMRYWRLPRCCRRSQSTSSTGAAAWRVSTSRTWATRGTW